MSIKHRPQKNASVPVEQAIKNILEMEISRREGFDGFVKWAMIGAGGMVLPAISPRKADAILPWLLRYALRLIPRLGRKAVPRSLPRSVPRTFPRAVPRSFGQTAKSAVTKGTSKAIPRGQTSILGKALVVADGAMIASMIPELVYALEDHRPKKEGELPPTPWLKDGRNDLELVVTNTIGEPFIDDLYIELCEYDSEEPISTLKMGELLVPTGEGKKFPIKHNRKHNKYVVNGLPERVPIATMLSLRGFLPKHPDVLVECSAPIIVGDSSSITYMNEIG